MRANFHTVTPYVSVRDADKFLNFCKAAFGAREIMCHRDDKGRVVHAEVQIGDSPIMITGESERFPDYKGIEGYGASPNNFFLDDDDPDGTMARAVAAGATLEMAAEDHPYGRGGGVKDPCGYIWWVTRHDKS